MTFEWDEAKRLTNLKKHGLDFIRADQLFDGRPTIELAAQSEGELRTLTIAILDGLFVTLVWTWRGANRRAISLRRSRDGERHAYRHVHG